MTNNKNTAVKFFIILIYFLDFIQEFIYFLKAHQIDKNASFIITLKYNQRWTINKGIHFLYIFYLVIYAKQKPWIFEMKKYKNEKV